MKLLLDTHIALWAIADTAKLSDEVVRMLESGENEVYYSMASVWEIAIKHKIKPEQMPMSEEEFVRLCEKIGFIQLPIETEHIFLLKTLIRPKDAPKHSDPFDRMLLAQAKREKLYLITHDSLIPYYRKQERLPIVDCGAEDAPFIGSEGRTSDKLYYGEKYVMSV